MNLTTERAIQVIECMMIDLMGGVSVDNKVAIMRYDSLDIALTALEEKLKSEKQSIRLLHKKSILKERNI